MSRFYETLGAIVGFLAGGILPALLVTHAAGSVGNREEIAGVVLTIACPLSAFACAFGGACLGRAASRRKFP